MYIFFHFHPEFPTDGNYIPTCLTCDLQYALFLEADGVISNSRSAQKRAFYLTEAKSRAPSSDDVKCVITRRRHSTSICFRGNISERGKRRWESSKWWWLAAGWPSPREDWRWILKKNYHLSSDDTKRWIPYTIWRDDGRNYSLVMRLAKF